MNIKKRLKNPSPTGVAVALAVLAAGGGIGYYLFTEKQKSKPKSKKSVSPPSPCQAQEGIPNYHLAIVGGNSCGTCKYYSTKASGSAVLGHCSAYDKSVSKTCVCDHWASRPGESEYGLSFNDDCSDFTMLEPPDGEDPGMDVQTQIFKDVIDAAIQKGGTIDPLTMAAEALNQMSPDTCEFPPSPDASPRIVQLYLYMVSLTAVIAIMSGGKIDGVDPEDMTTLDAKLAELTTAAGYPPFDPKVVPDLGPKQQQGPMLGEVSDQPTVDVIVPDFIMAKDVRSNVYAHGNLDEDTQIQLVNEDDLQGIEDLEIEYYGPGNILMKVKSMTPGLYRAYVRQSNDEAWAPTDATLEVQAAIPGLSISGVGGDNVPGFIPQQGG